MLICDKRRPFGVWGSAPCQPFCRQCPTQESALSPAPYAHQWPRRGAFFRPGRAVAARLINRYSLMHMFGMCCHRLSFPAGASLRDTAGKCAALAQLLVATMETRFDFHYTRRIAGQFQLVIEMIPASDRFRFLESRSPHSPRKTVGASGVHQTLLDRAHDQFYSGFGGSQTAYD